VSDRVAIVVGAGGLLGQTVASKLAADGAGAALWLTQAVAPHMEQAGSGAIVHVSARPGLKPTNGMAAYSLGKAALTHLIRVLDLELRPKGIRVNAVAPQLIDNPKNRSYFPAEVMAHSITPEAIAQVIAFLAGDASAPVSGAILPTYGRLTNHLPELQSPRIPGKHSMPERQDACHCKTLRRTAVRSWPARRLSRRSRRSPD
jgi:NAD(P)-dependent dehydrogenase (short-subunit alcohol dehydrogenase family)